MVIQMNQVFMDKVTSQQITYRNKSKKYLLPCLKVYGDVFISKLSSVFKVAIGVGDIIVKKTGQSYAYEKHLFVLLDSTISTSFFLTFIKWIQNQPMYIDDYVFDNIQKSNYHMVVIKFPEEFYDSFDVFKTGEYSKMFKKADIDKFFKKNVDVHKILVKDSNYKIEFTKKLNKIFGSTITPEEYEDGELDLPPKEEGEVFNTHLKHK